jgi:hypothetical protein
MFTADQLVAHAVGDYILQSDWMADNKTKSSVAAAIHALTYTLPFLLITLSPEALAVICGTHFVIDRWRLARFVVWLKNWPFYTVEVPGSIDGYGWRMKPVTATGYDDTKPPFLAVWLLIIADNILHVICNALAIQYLG